MRHILLLTLLLVPVALTCCARPGPAVPPPLAPPAPGKVVGIHLLGWTNDSLLVELERALPRLSQRGVNLIILEVDYSFAFESHPELRAGDQVITRAGARRFAAVCRQHGIRLVPQFQSLGHQSWAQTTFPLLTRYPELDLTPGAFPGNEGLYCREWDPTQPRVNQLVFPLIDEIVAAFQADAVHIGMDEIFLLGSEQSPSTRGSDPARVLARAINEFHDHFVKEGHLEMFMWGDRLIDGATCPYGEWESSMNGTAGAIDLIPRDIIICDWHYDPRPYYPSIPLFLDKGFRVLPSSWRDLEGVGALVRDSYRREDPRMLGHLFTTWSRPAADSLADWAPLVSGLATIRSGRFYDVGFELGASGMPGLLEVSLTTPATGLVVHYTTDGSEPTPASPAYTAPVRLERSATVRAIACRHGKVVSEVREQRYVVHLATGRPVTLASPPSAKYPPRGGAAALVNGGLGSRSYADGQWVGAEAVDLDATIDLGKVVEFGRVTVGSLNNRPNWVHAARRVEVEVADDGANFVPVGQVDGDGDEAPVVRLTAAFAPVRAQYVKVLVRNQVIPEGSPGAGQGAWLFVDEIVVE